MHFRCFPVNAEISLSEFAVLQVADELSQNSYTKRLFHTDIRKVTVTQEGNVIGSLSPKIVLNMSNFGSTFKKSLKALRPLASGG